MDLRDHDATTSQSDAEPLLGLAERGRSDAASVRSGSPPLLESVDPTRPDATFIPSGVELLISRHGSESTSGAHNETSVKGRSSLKKRDYLHGWRMGITLCAATSGTVFMINLVLTAWALSKYGLTKEGVGIIQEGSCKKTAHLSLWLHLIINLLSTLLLSASNYSMQCLASPTREEVDNAHSRKVWLDIGIPSVKNLNYIARPRIVLSWLLFFSGVPLHLFYNSAVFSTLSAQEYDVYSASPDLGIQEALNWSAPVGFNRTLGYFRDIRNTSVWQQLDNAACILAYAKPFVSARGDVVVISDNLNTTSLIELYAEGYANIVDDQQYEQYYWMCSISPFQFCNTTDLLENTSKWKVSPVQDRSIVKSCFSRIVDEHCRVQFSIVIISVVIACNFLKALCMLLTLRKQRSRPLVTLGDAIEEFLVNPDGTTRLACLSGKSSFSGGQWRDAPSRWQDQSHRWFLSLSSYRWFICIAL